MSVSSLRLVGEIYDAFGRRDGSAVLVVHVWTVEDTRVARLEVYIDTPPPLQALGPR